VVTESAPLLIATEQVQSPLGAITAYSWGETLVALEFDDGRCDGLNRLHRRFARIALVRVAPGRASGALQAYFAGEVDAMSSLSFDAHGTTFQRRVWTAVQGIEIGTTWTYGQIASRIGAPGAARAVGLANGANPLPILIPCHRVIGSRDALIGYGSGVERKRWLLNHERAVRAPTSCNRHAAPSRGGRPLGGAAAALPEIDRHAVELAQRDSTISSVGHFGPYPS
jgi:methylated-DNA-[protein]-cysteine S-methyltransferase